MFEPKWLRAIKGACFRKRAQKQSVGSETTVGLTTLSEEILNLQVGPPPKYVGTRALAKTFTDTVTPRKQGGPFVLNSLHYAKIG